MTSELAKLTEKYGAWISAQNLPHADAMELLHEDITPEQRRWLSDFIIEWDEAEKRAE